MGFPHSSDLLSSNSAEIQRVVSLVKKLSFLVNSQSNKLDLLSKKSRRTCSTDNLYKNAYKYPIKNTIKLNDVPKCSGGKVLELIESKIVCKCPKLGKPLCENDGFNIAFLEFVDDGECGRYTCKYKPKCKFNNITCDKDQYPEIKMVNNCPTLICKCPTIKPKCSGKLINISNSTCPLYICEIQSNKLIANKNQVIATAHVGDNIEYTLECFDGWYGEDCKTSINKCLTPNYCQNDGHCIFNGVKSFCWCKNGFQGHNCENKIDVCSIGNVNKCNFGTCVNGENNYSCKCDEGYLGAFCDQKIGGNCNNGIVDKNSFLKWKLQFLN